jgi:hypothetical protein
MDILVSDVQKMTAVAWLQYMSLQNTFILYLSPKQLASILNRIDLYQGESWLKKQSTFNLLTFVTIRMSMMPDPSVVGGGWQ